MAGDYTATDLRFDAESHTSTLPDGTDVPHVTTVLQATGLSVDFEDIADSSPRMAGLIEYARNRGRAVHADCHAYDDDDLDMSDVDPRILPFVEAWAWLREDKKLKPLKRGRERQVFHSVFFYTGILDGVFSLPDSRVALIDIATGDPDDSGKQYQTAAYEAAYLLEDPAHEIHERWAVQLDPRRRVPYVITNYSARPAARQDLGVFLSALTVYRHQACRRKKV